MTATPARAIAPALPVGTSTPLDLDAAGLDVLQAREQVAEGALAVVLDAGDADDLAGVHVEMQVVEQHAAVAPDGAQHRRAAAPAGARRRARRGGAASGQRRRGVRGVGVDHAERGVLAAQDDVAPDHCPRQGGGVGAGGGARLRPRDRRA